MLNLQRPEQVYKLLAIFVVFYMKGYLLFAKEDDNMVTLTMLICIALAVAIALVITVGGVLVVFLDPIIAILIIILLVKLIKWIIGLFRK